MAHDQQSLDETRLREYREDAERMWNEWRTKILRLSVIDRDGATHSLPDPGPLSVGAL